MNHHITKFIIKTGGGINTMISLRAKQAHLQFAQANVRPKIAKELAFPTHGETERNKARAHNRVGG